MAIPIEGLDGAVPTPRELDDYRDLLAAHHAQLIDSGVPYAHSLAAGEPLAAMLAGKSSLVWAKAEVIYDSPEKTKIEDGEQGGRLLRKRLGDVARQVQSELIVVSPYLVPGPAGMAFLQELRDRNVNVRILTNSLASSDVPMVHSGYQAYREPLLEMGVDLFEVRPVPGHPVDREHGAKMRSSGLYSLHAKAFVFDRQRVFIGSMNLDQRSLHVNTEVGLIIDSPELASQVAQRVTDIMSPANSYVLLLGEAGTSGGQRPLLWRTLEDGKTVDFHEEPAATMGQRLEADFFAFFPLDEIL